MTSEFKPYTYETEYHGRFNIKTIFKFEEDPVMIYTGMTKDIADSILAGLNGAYLMGTFHKERVETQEG